MFWYILVTLAVLASIATLRGLIVGDLLARGPVVQAEVIAIQRSSARNGTNLTYGETFAPVLQIEYPPGTKVTLNTTTSYASTPQYEVGDLVAVRVNEGTPENSSIDTPLGVYGVAAVKLLAPVALWALVWGLRNTSL